MKYSYSCEKYSYIYIYFNIYYIYIYYFFFGFAIAVEGPVITTEVTSSFVQIVSKLCVFNTGNIFRIKTFGGVFPKGVDGITYFLVSI